jgi:exodeoxyribonuclease VII small subunit
MSSKTRADAGQKSEATFDERLAKLEQIVAELEQGKIGLEDAIARYQQGTDLARECRSILDSFQRQVDELTEAGSKPYAGDPDSAKA